MPRCRAAALPRVGANYKNAVKGIDYSPIYLERFFRNLLLGEQWDLRNRYLHIHPTKEWSEQPNIAVPHRSTSGRLPPKGRKKYPHRSPSGRLLPKGRKKFPHKMVV